MRTAKQVCGEFLDYDQLQTGEGYYDNLDLCTDEKAQATLVRQEGPAGTSGDAIVYTVTVTRTNMGPADAYFAQLQAEIDKRNPRNKK